MAAPYSPTDYPTRIATKAITGAGTLAAKVARAVGNEFKADVFADGSGDTSVQAHPQRSVTVAPEAASRANNVARPGEAEIRASNARARVMAPGMAKEIDFASVPRDMGTYIPESQIVTPSIKAGAYRDAPGFGEFNSTAPRSLAQTVADADAARLLDETYGARRAANDAVAPHPQEDSLRAKIMNAQFDELQPAEGQRPLYSSGDTLGSFNRRGNSFTNNAPGLTLRQSLQQRELQLKNAEGMGQMERGRLSAELGLLAEDLARDVRMGRRTQAEADAFYARKRNEVQDQAGIIKSGFPPTDFGR